MDPLIIKPLSDIVVDESRLFTLLKGNAGSGKSIAAVSYPKPLLWMDCDKRFRAVKNFYDSKNWTLQGVNITWPDGFMQILDYLDTLIHSCPYRTIVPDSLTRLADMIISDAIQYRNPPGTDDDDKKKKARKLVAGGIELSQIEDFGAEHRGLTDMLETLQYISIKHGTNIVLTAHITTVDEKNLKGEVINTTRALWTGGRKIAAKIPTYFDEMYMMTAEGVYDKQTAIETTQFIARTATFGNDEAKTAFPKLSSRINYTDKQFYETLMRNVEVAKLKG